MINKAINKNLERLYFDNHSKVEKSDLSLLFHELTKQNSNPKNKSFNVNLGIFSSLFDDEEIKSFKKASKNKDLIKAFNSAKAINLDENEIIKKLTIDIDVSLIEANNKVKLENKEYHNQALILEYDHEPLAYLCGFGKGNYTIIDNPSYVKVSNELYAGIGKVDYRSIWNDFTRFNELLEEFEIYDQVWDTKIYQSLLKSYEFKTYLLLHEALKSINFNKYKDLKIEFPFYIYGNEHDIESISIYVYENN